MNIRIGFLETMTQSAPDYDLYISLPSLALPPGGYFDDCRRFATEQKIRLVTAPFIHEGQLVMAYLAPDGEFMQPACFPDSPFIAGDDLAVMDTPLGRLALAVGADIFQPQIARLAALRDCRILIAGLYPAVLMQNGKTTPIDRESWLMAGPWSAAQANCLPVAVAGPSGGRLMLPLGMSEQRDGFGADTIDMHLWVAAYREFPVFDSLNAALYRRYREELEA